MQQIRFKCRRGLSLVEVITAGTISLAIMAMLSVFTTSLSGVWHDGIANSSSQFTGETALQRIAPSVRAARGVIPASSSSTRLTLQLPAYDASGNLVIPLQDGEVISYYLSGTSGSVNQSGNILWRSVNGTPDAAWSLQNGRGRILVRPGGLTFTYYPSADPVAVRVALTTTASSGNRTTEFPTVEEFNLRNKGLGR